MKLNFTVAQHLLFKPKPKPNESSEDNYIFINFIRSKIQRKANNISGDLIKTSTFYSAK